MKLKKKAQEISYENVAAIALTDTHLNKDNFEQIIDIFVQAIDLAKKCKIKRILHLGDFFTNRVGQSLQTLLALKTILDLCYKEGIILIGIPGNHDKTNLDNEESYLDIFVGHRGFNLVYTQESFYIGDICFHFLPYFHNSYSERLSAIEIEVKDEINILCTHQAINGVKNNDGTEVTDASSPSAFKKFDKVLVGHYHNASQIGDNIYYIGSSHQSNFGETFDDKGFTIIYSDGSLSKVQSKFKKFIKVKLLATDKESIEDALQLANEEDANYRFVFGGNKVDLDNLNLTKFTEKGIQCQFENEEVNSEILKAENEELLQFDKGTLTKHLIKFAKIQEMESSKRNVGLKFMRELL